MAEEIPWKLVGVYPHDKLMLLRFDKTKRIVCYQYCGEGAWKFYPDGRSPGPEVLAYLEQVRSLLPEYKKSKLEEKR